MNKRNCHIGVAVIFAVVSMANNIFAQNFQNEVVYITTPAGYKIAGSYFSIKGEKGPAVLLLPNITGRRTSWDEFLPILKEAGVKSALAIDLPGSGASDIKDGEKVSWRKFSEKDFNDISGELNAVWDYLKNAPFTDSSHMGIMGSVLGANYAAVMAANNSAVRALVLLSPGLVYRGVASLWAMEKYEKKPILLVATKTDYFSAQSCGKMKEGRGDNIQVQIYNEPAYGTDILLKNPSFKSDLANWLKSNL